MPVEHVILSRSITSTWPLVVESQWKWHEHSMTRGDPGSCNPRNRLIALPPVVIVCRKVQPGLNRQATMQSETECSDGENIPADEPESIPNMGMCPACRKSPQVAAISDERWVDHKISSRIEDAASSRVLIGAQAGRGGVGSS